MSSSVSSWRALVMSSSTSSSALEALSLAALHCSSQTSTLSHALSFSTFIACIFFLMASMVTLPLRREVVNQVLDGLLSELSAGLGLFQLGAQGLDLLLVGLLPLVSLLLSNLQRLE